MASFPCPCGKGVRDRHPTLSGVFHHGNPRQCPSGRQKLRPKLSGPEPEGMYLECRCLPYISRKLSFWHLVVCRTESRSCFQKNPLPRPLNFVRIQAH
ncbi:uncharacterized protein [Chlorocebus sabaeus]|uniref:uncharacterized protein isoform X3 n=1 Tax=Chlorocebus sabaeus TaxID=60711 RepID=UPI003BFA2D2A